MKECGLFFMPDTLRPSQLRIVGDAITARDLKPAVYWSLDLF